MVSPGVPLNTPELVQVRSFGLPVIGELELAARFLKGKILAITGSNGKTTTTALLGEILKEGGLPTLVGGNIGVPVVASSRRAQTTRGRCSRFPASSSKAPRSSTPRLR